MEQINEKSPMGERLGQRSSAPIILPSQRTSLTNIVSPSRIVRLSATGLPKRSSAPPKIVPLKDSKKSPEQIRLEFLREAFDLIDADKQGTLTMVELGTFFSLLGDDLTPDDLLDIMHQVGANADHGMDFSQFATLMHDIDLSDMEVQDIAIKFVEKAHEKSKSFQHHKPLWQTFREDGDDNRTGDGIFFKKNKNARMQLAMLIDGTMAQAIVLCLILIDVVCVLCELLLLATMCPCGTYAAASDSSYGSSYGGSSYGSYSSFYASTSSMDSMMSMNGEDLSNRMLSASGTCSKGELQYSPVQDRWHVGLHWLSVSILGVFALQIVSLMLVYRCKFFTNPFYVLDCVVIFGALYFELSSDFQEGRLVTILMAWRLLRVMHGLVSSIELQAKQRDNQLEEERSKLKSALTDSRRNLAKSRIFYYSYMSKMKNRGVEPADQEFFKTSHGFRTPEAAHLASSIEHDSKQWTLMQLELAKDAIARSEAEAMFMSLYNFLESHHDHLKTHEEKIEVKTHKTPLLEEISVKKVSKLQIIKETLKKKAQESVALERVAHESVRRGSISQHKPSYHHSNTHHHLRPSGPLQFLPTSKTQPSKFNMKQYAKLHNLRDSSDSSPGSSRASSRAGSRIGSRDNGFFDFPVHVPFLHAKTTQNTPQQGGVRNSDSPSPQQSASQQQLRIEIQQPQSQHVPTSPLSPFGRFQRFSNEYDHTELKNRANELGRLLEKGESFHQDPNHDQEEDMKQQLNRRSNENNTIYHREDSSSTVSTSSVTPTGADMNDSLSSLPHEFGGRITRLSELESELEQIEVSSSSSVLHSVTNRRSRNLSTASNQSAASSVNEMDEIVNELLAPQKVKKNLFVSSKSQDDDAESSSLATMNNEEDTIEVLSSSQKDEESTGPC